VGSVVQNLDDVSLGVLFMGVSLGFSSMGDVKDISKKEEKLFNNGINFKRQVRFLIIVAFSLVVVSLLFMSMKWFGRSEVAGSYYQLGVNCSPLVLAVLFTLKQLLDKKEYFEVLKKERENEVTEN
jgi:hypothetical protein